MFFRGCLIGLLIELLALASAIIVVGLVR